MMFSVRKPVVVVIAFPLACMSFTLPAYGVVAFHCVWMLSKERDNEVYRLDKWTTPLAEKETLWQGPRMKIHVSDEEVFYEML
jgi:hypothetical protein